MELNDDALEKARRGSFDVAKHIGLSAPLRRKGNSASEAQKSGTYILAGSLTFPSRDHFAMLS